MVTAAAVVLCAVVLALVVVVVFLSVDRTFGLVGSFDPGAGGENVPCKKTSVSL
jgi:hypothetical protein